MIDIVQIFEDAATASGYEFAYGRKDIQNWQLTESVALESGETVLLVDPFVETAEIDNSIIFKWSVRTTIALGKKVDTDIDWFMPSKDLLAAMRTNLHAEGVGDFTEDYYWSSSEIDSDNAWAHFFDLDVAEEHMKSVSTNAVRACRSFTAGVGDYSLRDTGPAGGLICYIDGGTTYYEAAPSDQSTNQIWSNITNIEIGETAQGTAIGTGQANTTAIIAQAGHTDSAAKLCDDFEVLRETYAQLDETELQKHDRRLQTMRENMETLIKSIFCNEDMVLTAAVILREINQFDENIDIIAAEITFNYDS